MATASMKPWSLELKEGQTITKVLIKHGFVVNGIGFEITDKDGEKEDTIWYEGTEPVSHRHPVKVMQIPLDNDFVTHISGTYGRHQGETCIITLKIHTDLHPEGYAQCGKFKEASEVTPFSSPLPMDDSIVGYLGCTDKFLGSIGIFALGNKTTKSELYGDVDSKINWYMKLKKDEHISKLTIKSGFVVDGFVFEVKNKTTGNSYSQKFSGPGENEDLITLEDDEVITQIDGVYGDYNKEGIKIALIKIYTNLHPEGMEYGNLDDVTNTENFSYTVPSMNSSIVGFYGSYGLLLNSFGIIDETKEFHKYGPYGRPTFA